MNIIKNMAKLNNILGQKFGKITVIKRNGSDKNRNALWLCSCECGGFINAIGQSLLKNQIRSCDECNNVELSGLFFGDLLVIERLPTKRRHRFKWLCRCCNCGKEKKIYTSLLVSGHARSCGCGREPDISNKKFNLLTAIKEVEKDKHHHSFWLCKCECGNEKIIEKHRLINGITKSCGCLAHKPLPAGEACRNSILDSYKRNAKKKNLDFQLTVDQMDILLQDDCFYCGKPPSNKMKISKNRGTYYWNGIDRVNNELDYTIENVVTCCRQCNVAKNKHSKDDFISWIYRVFTHLSLPRPQGIAPSILS